MGIPVENIYYLLCYAWGHYRGGDVIDVKSLETTRQVDLFAKVLIDGTKNLLRRGLDRGYETFEEQIAGIRGQINFDASLKKMLLKQGKAQCRIDEFTVDVLHNQLLKATMRRLAGVDELDRELRGELVRLVRSLPEVSELTELRPAMFRRVRLHRNNQHYRFLLNICELLLCNLLVSEETGETRFQDVLRDETRMSSLFEHFVRNFYDRELQGFRARAEHLSWGAVARRRSDLDLLPRMVTDITLWSAGRVIIIDTKYYKNTLQSWRGGEGGSVHSGNLYQLYAYLRSYQRSKSCGEALEGMLLYPVVDQELRLDYEIDGFRVQVCTVNLARTWREIEAELLALVSERVSDGEVRMQEVV